MLKETNLLMHFGGSLLSGRFMNDPDTMTFGATGAKT